MYRHKAELIFKNIPMKMESFYDKFEKEYNDIPIIKYYDAYQIFQRISNASNEDIVTIKEMLVNRSKNKKLLLEEAPVFLKLKRIIDDYVEGKKSSIKVVMLDDFNKGLDEILDRYNAVIKQNADKISMIEAVDTDDLF